MVIADLEIIVRKKMMQKTVSDEAECAKGICKPKSTAMFDNEDCLVSILHISTTKDEAETVLQQLIDKAHDIESEPCSISHNLTSTEQGWRLNADFNFCCQAEAVIFQMALRRVINHK